MKQITLYNLPININKETNFIIKEEKKAKKIIIWNLIKLNLKT